MSQVSVDPEQVKNAYNVCQDYIQLVAKTKSELSIQLNEISSGWNDSKYQQLLYILSDCLKGLNKPLESIELISNSLEKLMAAIEEYESVNLGGGTSNSSSNASSNGHTANSVSGVASNVSMTNEERAVAVKQAGETWSNNISQDEARAIRDYTGNMYYQNINSVLRGLDSGFDSGNCERANLIHSALSQSQIPCDCTVYRGTSLAALGEFQNLSNEDLVGHTIVDYGFMSTSLNSSDAFGGDIRLEISVPQGTNGAYVGYLSNCGHAESEVLLDAGQTMEITGARHDMFGNRIISLRII